MTFLNEDHRRRYKEDGYCVVPGLFTSEEVAFLREHYMELRKEDRPGDFSGVDLTSNDPLARYPRMIHMHRWDEVSFQWAIDPRLDAVMTELTGESPYMVQTMLYFKPPGARGQAMHQDQFYLRAQPGTCIAAWLALDDTDEENGCMRVVPGMPEIDLLCTVAADTTQSFTDVTVPLPEGVEPTPIRMQAGDVLFFHGAVIHGSYPNVSQDRFRRALIGHYVTGDCDRVNAFYHPAFRMDGRPASELEVSVQGGKCGVWVERDGTPVIELVDPDARDTGPTEEQLMRQ